MAQEGDQSLRADVFKACKATRAFPLNVGRERCCNPGVRIVDTVARRPMVAIEPKEIMLLSKATPNAVEIQQAIKKAEGRVIHPALASVC